jgi:two-component system cell cycle sensor histidine kinase/response regulator CckA
MSVDKDINKNNKLDEIIICTQFLTYLFTAALLILSMPESYSFMGFYTMLFGLFVPACVIAAFDYYLFFFKKVSNNKVFLWLNIFKIILLFALITVAIIFSLQRFPFFAGMYLLPVVVTVVTFGRVGGLILAGAASVSLFMIIFLSAWDQNIYFGPILLFSAILLLVAWFLGEVMAIERNTKMELLDLIFKQKKMENVLRDNEESLRQIIKVAPIAMLIHIDGKIIYGNDYASRIVNVPNSQYLIGKNLQQLLGDHFKEIINLKKFKGGNSKIKQSDGTIIDVEYTNVPFFYKGKEAVQTLLNNITERKRMEEELYKANKLESLAILAGGVAHDFNNLLAVILGNVSLIKTYKDLNKIAERAGNIEKVVVQARELTQQLFIFSKGEVPVKKTTCLKKLIEDIVKFSLSGTNVNFDCVFPDDDYLVEIDKSQINQVFNNLIINAVQSMSEGGTIHIIAKRVVVDEQEKEYLPLKEGNYIKVSVRDEGVGMPEQFLKNIFDPFFTTKVEGTGLGLAIAYSIIQKHGGFIGVDSIINVGTTFNIYLPVPVLKIRLAHQQEEGIVGGEGRVLLIDDQDTVRQVAKEMLTSLGYEADVVTNGTDAIELYKNALDHGEKYDVVIMDLTIPAGMGAVATIKELFKIDREVKAILSSGYSIDPVIFNFRNYNFQGFLSKPYSIEELGKVLHDVIGKQVTGSG